MKHKIISSLFLFCFCFSFANAQTPSWLWARSGLGTGSDECYAIAADAFGNTFAVGNFSSPSITFGTHTLNNTGSNDPFIVKYDPSGNALWAKSVTGVSGDIGTNVATDAAGNVYFVGWFDSPSVTIGSFNLTLTGSANIFFAKYDPNGNVLWAKSSQGSSSDQGSGVATDMSGNVYITGEFSSSTITFGTQTLSNSGSLDVFLTKYDGSGNVLWAKSGQGTSVDWGNSVATDTTGNVYVTGRFNSASITFGTTTVNNSGPENIFLVKYDSLGSVIWVKSEGGNGYDYGNGVTTDGSNNVYLTGGFDSPTINFGTYSLTNTGNDDVFITKYNSSGAVLWAKSGIGSSSDIGYGVSTDLSGNVYAAGRFSYLGANSITFGSNTLPFPSGGTDPMFIVKYDPSGNVLCAIGLGSGGDDNCGVATDAFGNVYVGGDFMMNNFVVGTNTLTLTGSENIFVAKAIFSCGASAADELENEESFSISPNPSSGIFDINSTEKIISEIVYDILGNKIYESKTDLTEINISNTSPGIYFLQMETGKGRVVKKIVKE